MAPVKRASNTEHPEATLSKKAKDFLKEDGVYQREIKAVVEGIQQNAELSESCRHMLSAMVPFGLGVGTDKRGDYQKRIVDMVGEVFDAVSANMSAALDAGRNNVKDVEGSKATREAKVGEMESLLAAAAENTAAKKTALEEARASKLEKDGELTTAKNEQREGDAVLDGAEAERNVFQGASDNELQALKTEELTAAVSKKHQAFLVGLLKKISADDSLLTALPTVCHTKPDKRGQFDTMVLDQIGQALVAKVTELDSTLAKGPADREARAATVAGATSAAEVAMTALTSAEEAFHAAKSSEAAAGENLKAAQAAVASFEVELKDAEQARDAKEAVFNTFKEQNLATFTELRDRVSRELHKQQVAEARAAEQAEFERQQAAEAAEAERKAAEEAAAAAAAAAAAPVEAAAAPTAE